MDDTPEVTRARSAFKSACTALGLAHKELREAIYAVSRRFSERLHAAKLAEGLARDALNAAIRNATPYHEWHGRRVLIDEPVYIGSGAWKRQSGRFNTTEWEVSTYRPGYPKPTWGYVSPGDGIVFPILKSGKVGKKPQQLTKDHRLKEDALAKIEAERMV